MSPNAKFLCKKYIFHIFRSNDTAIKMATNITYLPPEVLEIIFEKLFSIKDIVSCNKTCTKWKYVIQSMFKDKGTCYLHLFNRKY